jgi:hypothetical protein
LWYKWAIVNRFYKLRVYKKSSGPIFFPFLPGGAEKTKPMSSFKGVV